MKIIAANKKPTTPRWPIAFTGLSMLFMAAAASLSTPHAVAQTQDNPPPAAQSGETAPSAPPQDAAAQPQAQDAAQTPPATPPAAAAAADAPPPPAAQQTTTLRVAAPRGAQTLAQEQAVFAPFTKRDGHQIQHVAYDGTFDAFKRQASEWDVVYLDGASAARACSEQLLEPIDAAALQPAPNGAAPAADFLPGALQPCAVASSAWSAVVVYNKGAKKEPAKLADFFDIKRFPGKRLLPKDPRFMLELALLADNVPPADVYAVLSTPDGQTRALSKLAALKDRIQWYDKPSEVFDLLGGKDVAMGLAFSGRAFMAIVSDRKPVGILWDRQVYAFDYWGIPHGAKNAAAARDFIRFATASEQLAAQARLFPYGPARRSALPLAGRHAELDIDLKPFLPTHDANLRGALAFDGAWWNANEGQIRERFAAWLAAREIPVPQPPAR